MSVTSTVIHDLSALLNRIKLPRSDSNTSTALTNALVWQEARKYCEAQEKIARKELDDLAPIPTSPSPGDHVLAEGDSVLYMARVSKPRVTFNLDLFVSLIAKKHKIREPILRTLIAPARSAGKSAVSRFLAEKGSHES